MHIYSCTFCVFLLFPFSTYFCYLFSLSARHVNVSLTFRDVQELSEFFRVCASSMHLYNYVHVRSILLTHEPLYIGLLVLNLYKKCLFYVIMPFVYWVFYGSTDLLFYIIFLVSSLPASVCFLLEISLHN